MFRCRGRHEPAANQRGAVSAFVTFGMTVLLGSAAIAIDIGHIMTVRTESQRVADLSALAAASAFVTTAPGAPISARRHAMYSEGISFAALNTVDKQAVTLTDGDFEIDWVNERVRVTVRHTATNGNAVSTIFARVLGFGTIDIVTTAVAQAYAALGAKCLLPWVLPDKYQENGGDPTRFGAPPDAYAPFDPQNPQAFSTGYSDADVGTQLVISPSQGTNPGQPAPHEYYTIAALSSGAAAYDAAISGCVDPLTEYHIGDVIQVQPGAQVGSSRPGVDALLAQAPNHGWSTTHNCVVDSSDPNLCISSPRLRPAPMVAPPDVPGNGSESVAVANWAGVFVEGMQGNDVVVRFAGYSAFSAVASPGGGAGPLAKVIRLVE